MPLVVPPGTPPAPDPPIAGTAATDADPAAVPTLCRLPGDDLLVCYHTPANHLRIWISSDLGGGWTARANLSDLNYQYPRLVWAPPYLYLAFYWANVGTPGVRVIRSSNFGISFLTGLNDSINFPEPQAQLPSLRVDRRGVLRLAMWDSAGEQIVHRYVDSVDSLNKDHWTAPTLLSPTFGSTPAPVYVLGKANRGVLVYYDDVPARKEPRIRGLTSTYDQVDVGPPYPAGDWVWPTVAPPPSSADSDIPAQYAGVLVDRRDHIWTCHRDAAGMLRTYVSDDDGHSFGLLPG